MNQLFEQLKLTEQKLQVAERKLEESEQRKYELTLKQKRKAISSNENLELEKVVDSIKDFRRDKEHLQQEKLKWMNIIKLAINKESRIIENGCFEFKGKLWGSNSVKVLIQTLYRAAHSHCASYHPFKTAFEYKDSVLCVDILFKKEQNAVDFETEFLFINTSILYSDVELECEIIPVDLNPPKERIFLKHYRPGDYYHSDGSESESEFTSYQPTDDLVVYQSLEKMEYLEFGCEGGRLMPPNVCKLRGCLELEKSENNRLALSRQLNGYVEGIGNGFRPSVRLNYVPSDEETVDGRYRVIVGVEFKDEQLKNLFVPWLKDSCREQVGNPLVYKVEVFVRNKQDFIKCLEFRSEKTLKLWKELGFR